MAFTFLVEDGTGVPGANSYVSIADADNLLQTNIHASSEWMALSLANKQALLMNASRYLDDRTRWNGTRVSETSGLRWPRTGVSDRDGFLIPANTIPTQLRFATAEMARFNMAEDRTVERSQDAISRLKADVVELEFVEGYRLPKVPEHMRYLLLGLGTIAGSGVTFGKVIR